ncbi:aminodeoxychorismate synthase component I [Acidaminobacter hydrogenoformans]|uniref:aminodeoxychorismate synthase n=1 Tax=Acidaminobacter hydrogenoformans DSM 2784 TaxID=1120920 RepID=A0A1G5RW64_9FIRM|nr:aminodeoxychorismate synthase component I [Acidaminobacter hydrogenoformans]SCZ77681.1 aminodeoxychorismate synthase, subunit I [Acidaminobacter hydrogenoformans DSM 2784]
MIKRKLQTSLDSFRLFLAVSDLPHPLFLDSGMDPKRLGRWSLIMAAPFERIRIKGDSIELENCLDGTKTTQKGNAFDFLKSRYELYQTERTPGFDLPFGGGMAGYLAYDLCHHVETLPRTAKDDVNIPDAILGLYETAILVDHQLNEAWLAELDFRPGAEARMEAFEARIREAEKSGLDLEPVWKTTSPTFESNFNKEDYLESIRKIKRYIRSGDLYQVNMTQRFTAEMTDEPLMLYKKLRTINPAPFSAYMPFEEATIISSSPERFIQIRNGEIETRPIKGTRPRGKTPEEDAMESALLLASEKDRSELLMIVDLERNDLGKVAEVGTVKVPELFVIEEYPTVYHLVSTVTATLKAGLTPIDLLKASFPGGSITGAPKIRAMEIIDELEPTQRNLYTGSIGYIGFNGDTDLNIVIRTIVAKEGKAYFQVGGGIVWDSDEYAEYEETLHKARALMKALSS